MIRLGGKSDNVLVSQVKVLSQSPWPQASTTACRWFSIQTAMISGSIRLCRMWRTVVTADVLWCSADAVLSGEHTD